MKRVCNDAKRERGRWMEGGREGDREKELDRKREREGEGERQK